MAVVEVGWTIRAGYIGDARCTRQFPSICCATDEQPMETSFPSILRAADSRGGVDDNIQSIWTLKSVEDQMDQHVKYLQHIMENELQCLEDSPLMLVVPEMWHERFDLVCSLFHNVLELGFASALYCCRPSVTWTLSSGKTSAIVMDIGHNQSTATAVLDGYALRGSINSSSIAGSAVTEGLIEMLNEEELDSLESVRQYNSSCARKWAVYDTVNDIKRMACFVRVGQSAGLQRAEESLLLRAPDGSSIRVPAKGRAEPYEVLFSSPTAVVGAGSCLADLLLQCKRSLDPEWQQEVVAHVMCGGTSQAPGLCERLMRELQRRDSSYFRYEKENAFHLSPALEGAWTGASLAATSSSFAYLWVTRADLEEEGDSVLHRKLFY